jgi:peptide/nickel transport system substrate-binding protein
MTIARKRHALALGAGAVALAVAGGSALADTPKRGGVLNFVVGSKIPTYDAHRESTFGMIHPIRPFYSLLIRVNPDNPQSPTDFQCDLCEGGVPSPTNDGKTYTFSIRKDVQFHDGTPLTAHDVKATFDKLISPPEGIISNRKAQFSMIESVEAADDYTLVFRLKYPSGAFIPVVAQPFNFVYAKKDLEREDPEGKDPLYGMKWHQTNVNGTGAFMFVQHQPGAFVEGKRYDGYHHEGKPYLDGYKAISAPKTAVRINAIRGDRAAIEFRGFAPKQRDDLVAALGDQITVQESDWNCQLLISINHKKAPFDDVRVRKALMHAVDRWGASESLSQIAIVKTVAGIVFPSHELAIDNDTLKTYVGFWPDIGKAREEAKQLLKEAGAEDLTFDLHNRAVDMPYRILGTWLIGEWKKIGVSVTQEGVATSEWYAKHRAGTHDLGIDANCQSVINPVADVSKYTSRSRNPPNRSHYEDPVLDEMHDRLLRSGDPAEQAEIMRAFEKRVLHDEARYGMTLWWNKINPHRSYVKGWNIAPSHYLNQHLDQVWIDKG